MGDRKLTPEEVDRELASVGVEFADESEYEADAPTEFFVAVPREKPKE